MSLFPFLKRYARVFEYVFVSLFIKIAVALFVRLQHKIRSPEI